MNSFKIKFSGKTLERGFWIYVVQITNPKEQRYFYVGMTGDSSSFNAASLFVRMGRHLEDKGLDSKGKEKAKGSTLFRAIKKEKELLSAIYKLDFEVIGFYLSKENKEDHRKIRGEIAILEDNFHKDLEKEGYTILGSKFKKNPIVPQHRQKEYLDILESVKRKFKK